MIEKKLVCDRCGKITGKLFDEPGCSGDYAAQVCYQCYERRVDMKMMFRKMMSEIIEENERREALKK